MGTECSSNNKDVRVRVKASDRTGLWVEQRQTWGTGGVPLSTLAVISIRSRDRTVSTADTVEVDLKARCTVRTDLSSSSSNNKEDTKLLGWMRMGSRSRRGGGEEDSKAG